MFVICQTDEMTLQTTRRLLEDRKNVFLTNSHHKALKYVRDNEPILDRMVVVLSDFYPGEISLNGSVVATAVKGMNPSAWCIIWTSMRCSPKSSVDGVIDKVNRDHLDVPYDPIRQLVDTGIDDPKLVPDLDALYARFPWIQRPAR